MIKATDITFKRRSRQRDSFGTMQQRYEDCTEEYVSEQYEQFCSIKSGYDWCILSIIDEKNYYAKFVADVTIKPTAEICDKVARFSIFGYPCYKPKKFRTAEEEKKEKQTHKRIPNDGMFGMPSNQIQKMRIKNDDMGTMNHFLFQTCIDTEGGQSGAAIFCQNKHLNNSTKIKTSTGVTIFGIHVGGSESKKYNVCTVITNDILCKIHDICGTKLAITKVDETDIKSNETWNPFNGKDKQEFKAHIGIDFSADGIGVAIGLPSSKIIWQETQVNNPNIKEKPSILLQTKPSFELIAFGVEATEKYESIKKQNTLYFDNFVTSSHCVRYENDEKAVSELQAENKEFVPTKIVFTIVVKYLKKNIMKTLKTILDVENVEDVQWILTVPHYWSGQKLIILEVMKQVGLSKENIADHVLLTTHPQTSSVIARERYYFQQGTKYMLIDVGEETSYIACHIVTGNMTKHIYPVQLVEVGFNSVDRACYDKLGEIFGKDIVGDFAAKHPYRWIMMKNKLRNAALLYDGTNKPNLILDVEFIQCVETKRGKGLEDVVEDHDEKLGSIEYDEGVMELSTEIWDQWFDSLLKVLISKGNKVRRAKVMEGFKDILLIGTSAQCKFLQNKLQTAFDTEVIHTMSQQYLASMEGAIKIGLRTSTYISAKTIAIQTIGSGFCSLIVKGNPTYSCDPHLQWFTTCGGNEQKQIAVKLYSSDEQYPTHMKGSCEGIGFVNLPSNWKHDQPIAILYMDNYIDKKLYIANKKWQDNEREIKMQWSNKLSW